ncbi:hypothetical protein AB7V68_01375, partial [Escherichia coli]
SDGNGSHASTLKSPSYTKSVSWQHYLCLYIDNSFAITRISPLWAGLIGVCTFIAALLLTSKR